MLPAAALEPATPLPVYTDVFVLQDDSIADDPGPVWDDAALDQAASTASETSGTDE